MQDDLKTKHNAPVALGASEAFLVCNTGFHNKGLYSTVDVPVTRHRLPERSPFTFTSSDYDCRGFGGTVTTP